MTVDVGDFLKVIRPALEAGDAQALAQVVAQRWSPLVMCRILRCRNVDARRATAVVLGLIGDRTVVPCLAKALHDPDRQVSKLAENGLWSIWFRGGNPSANCYFREGLALFEEESFTEAAERFKIAAQIDSCFAEAFHQCGMAYNMLGDSGKAVQYFFRAVEEEPNHFGAFAGMGSSYADAGDLKHALQSFRKALRINPNMPTAAQAIDRLSSRVSDKNDWSGIYTAQVANV